MGGEIEFEHIDFKKLLIGLGGALPLALPIDLLLGGEAALLTGIVVGVGTYMYGDEISAFVRNRLPSLDQESVKRHLLSIPGQAQGDDDGDIYALHHQERGADTRYALSNPVEEHHLDIAPTLRPHVNKFFGSRVGVFGIPGSGKSNTVAVLLEELSLFACPMLILDTENESAAFCKDTQFFSNPNHESAISITPENARAWGEAIMENCLQVVLNLQSYKNDDDAAEVMVGLIEGMNAWEEAQDMKVPCVIVLDEAHKWLPQKASMSCLSKQEDENGFTLQDRLEQVFLGTVASRGRKRGMGLIFATQRLPLLNKSLIMCEWLFLLRQTLSNDLATYRQMGCPPEIAQKLSNGQAYVITPDRAHDTHQIRLRYSESGANTPGLSELEHYKLLRSQNTFTSPPVQAQYTPVNIPVRECVNEPAERVNACESSVNIHGDSQAPENAVNANLGVPLEVREQILKAIIEMQSQGMKVTRTALRDYLEWGNRHYAEVLKPVLDDMGLLK